MAEATKPLLLTPLRYFYRQLTITPKPVNNVNLEGKTAIVTGSNTGVGFAISRQLLELGISRLIIAVRNEEKGKAAATKLASDLSLNPDIAVEVWKLDLSAYDSIVAFADRANTLSTLDIVVLNAGMWSAIKRDFNAKTGHEEVIQVNYLSNALLLILLLPIAKAKRDKQSAPTRICFTSSEVAAFTKFNERNKFPLLAELDKPGDEVDRLDRMFISKLLVHFFIFKIAKLVPPSVAVINTASPGAIHDSEFNRDMPQNFGYSIFKHIQKIVANSSEVGARVVTDAAVRHGEEIHGHFLSFQRVVSLAPIVYTEEGYKIAEQLWEETMEELSFANTREIINRIES
ncbi:NAD(P)-binding protein [Xylariaceae sp. FL0255]|nr:NAD(P)-binding protein [Xylariaceae sp. FL0255]